MVRPEGRRGPQLKGVLADAAVRLSRADALPELEAALRERLGALPLFERASGVLVSLEEARSEKVASG